MALIFFGFRGREERRGMIAEHCPVCNGPRPFAVVEHYEVGHVYYIPLGEGTHQGTSMQCMDCDSHFQFDGGKYLGVVPVEEARQIPFEELVMRTNVALTRALFLSAPARCQSCGYERDRPFRFCPKCGTEAEK